MDEMLFPAEALQVLRQACHDPDATRGIESLSTGFYWSDEQWERARRICRRHASRAPFYILAYRSSLIQGQPMEEYRPTWDQLQMECPNWPGFRRERGSTDLLPERERKLICIGIEKELRNLEADNT